MILFTARSPNHATVKHYRFNDRRVVAVEILEGWRGVILVIQKWKFLWRAGNSVKFSLWWGYGIFWNYTIYLNFSDLLIDSYLS